MTRFSHRLLGHRRLVLVGWLAVLAAGIALAPAVNQRLSDSFSLPGQQGYEANLAIAETYGTGGHAHPIVPVITLPPARTVDTPGIRQALARAFGAVARDLDGRVVSYASTGDRRFVAADGRTTFGLVFPGDHGGDPSATAAAALQAALPAGATVRVTGIDQLTAHGGRSPGGEVVNLTLVGAVGALLVLLVVFGSLLALAPLLVAVVAILATLLLVGALTTVTEVNLIVEYLVALIGLGVAIDYSLLLVTRWREERAHGHPGDEAVHRAMATAGRSVLLSASTVAIGLLALVVLPVPFLRSVGYAGVLIPLVSALVTVTLLPVLLASGGRRLDWPRRRLRREATSSRAWTAWASAVVRARWAATLVAVAALAALGAFALDLRVGEAQASSLASAGPAHEGLVRLLDAGVPSGVLTPIELMLPQGADPGAVAARLAGLPGVWTVAAPDDPTWRRGGTALIQVQPRDEPGTRAGQQTVQRVRAAVEGQAPGARVGGVGAEDLDFARAIYGRFPLMVAVIAAITFVLLARAFRSLLLAAKAVLVDLLSIGAVYGAIVVVWQQGHGSRAIAGTPGTGALDVFVPLFVFAFLFGLSMDYEVFLLARMREAYDRTGSTTQAVVEGVGRTGRLVTSAALILFLAFAALAGAQDTVTKVFATGLGAGILLDATVVRSVLVPALVVLAGRWNWWLPAWAARPLRVAPSSAPPEPVAGDLPAPIRR
jgi:putative drug exporter of the RND superfamily